jgi:hypothetical protein
MANWTKKLNAEGWVVYADGEEFCHYSGDDVDGYLERCAIRYPGNTYRLMIAAGVKKPTKGGPYRYTLEGDEGKWGIANEGIVPGDSQKEAKTTLLYWINVALGARWDNERHRTEYKNRKALPAGTTLEVADDLR